MCLAVIKKSDHPDFAFFIAFVRDELFEKRWEGMGKHWPEFEDVYGYKDVESGGTWFAANNHLLALTLNREPVIGAGNLSRGDLALKAISGKTDASDVTIAMRKFATSKIRPFNLLIADRKAIYIVTNVSDDKITHYPQVIQLNNVLTLLNRTVPNDMRETRIKSLFQLFLNAAEPNPGSKIWTDWSEIMRREATVATRSDESAFWLKSNEWASLNADIIALPKDHSSSFIIHHVKSLS